VVLGVLLAGTVTAQVLTPGAAARVGAQYPEVARLEVPYSVAAILALVCLQVALATVWWLVTARARGLVRTPRTIRCLDVLAACGGVLTGLSAGVLVHVLAVVKLGGPAVVLTLAACVLAAMALVVLAAAARSVLAARIGRAA
jgi:hypothetical protein